MSEASHRDSIAIAGSTRISRGSGGDVARMPIGRGGGPVFAPRIARVGHRHARPQHMGITRPSVPAAIPDESLAGRKAAFTLRLDATRHARLRDACANSQRSAQQLVTQALDHFLAAVSGGHFETSAARATIRTGGF